MKQNLYLIEYYILGPENTEGAREGSTEIKFAWVYESDPEMAVQKLRIQEIKDFDVVIDISDHIEIVTLDGCSDPLILR